MAVWRARFVIIQFVFRQPRGLAREQRDLNYVKRRDFSSFRRTGRGNEGNECRGRFRQHAGHSVHVAGGGVFVIGQALYFPSVPFYY